MIEDQSVRLSLANICKGWLRNCGGRIRDDFREGAHMSSVALSHFSSLGLRDGIWDWTHRLVIDKMVRVLRKVEAVQMSG